MAKRGLGKGLGVLFPEQDFNKDTVSLELSAIRPNPYQPREEYSDNEITTLVDSIKNKGIIQPIVVRKINNFYEIVCGERRYRAAKKAGLKSIPVVIRDLQDREALELALIENLQRKDLNPIEEAKTYNRLIKEFGLTQSDVAKVVGKKRSTVTNTLRLLKLPHSIQSMILRDEITEGHARAILSLRDETSMLSIARKIKKKTLSVRDVERLIQKKIKVTKKSKARDLFLSEVERILREKLGTKCTIREKGKTGRIIIEFYSKEDLERILDILSIAMD